MPAQNSLHAGPSSARPARKSVCVPYVWSIPQPAPPGTCDSPIRGPAIRGYAFMTGGGFAGGTHVQASVKVGWNTARRTARAPWRVGFTARKVMQEPISYASSPASHWSRPCSTSAIARPAPAAPGFCCWPKRMATPRGQRMRTAAMICGRGRGSRIALIRSGDKTWAFALSRALGRLDSVPAPGSLRVHEADPSSR